METKRRCKKCGSGPVLRQIDSWGRMGDYVFLTCACGREIWDARPLSSSEEGNWAHLLDGQQSSEESVRDAGERLPLPYMRAVAASPERMSVGRLLAVRVALPVLVTSILVALNVWAANHWKSILVALNVSANHGKPPGPATLI